MAASIVPLLMPRWGIDMAEGRLVRWLIAEGEPVGPGTPVLEVESEKTIAPVEASDAGTLRRKVALEGDQLPVGALLGVIAAAEVPEQDVEAFVADLRVRPRDAEVAAPREGTVELLGHSIRYLELGSGAQTVVLVHGFGGSLESWGPVQAALARRFRTLSLDLPGHGASSKALSSAGPEFFTALIAGFLRALGASRVHLVGHSWGGNLAAAFAQRAPDAVASLTLIGATGRSTPAASEFLQTFIAATRRGEVKSALLRLFGDPRFVTREMVELVLKYRRLDGAEAALRRIAEAEGTTDGDGPALRLPGSIPVQIIGGDADALVPIGSAALPSPGAELYVLEHVGHMPHIEASARVAELIAAFAARGSDPARG